MSTIGRNKSDFRFAKVAGWRTSDFLFEGLQKHKSLYM